MNCNGIRSNIFVVVCLLLILQRNTIGEIAETGENMPECPDAAEDLSENGSLDGLFHRDLPRIQNGIGNDDTYVDARPNNSNGGDKNAAAKRSTTIDNCLYEELKRRVDRFNNDLLMNPSEALQRRVDELREDYEKKRSTVRENMYEEYKKRLDKIGNDLSWDDESVFDRNGRSFPLNKEAYEDYVQRMRKIGEAFYPGLSFTAIDVESPQKIVLEREQSFTEERYEDEPLFHDYDNKGPPIAEQSAAIYGIEAESSYPAVLTKAFETNMGYGSTNLSPVNLLASVAEKMNTSMLELAQKLTNITDKDTAAMSQDPKLAEMLQKYITRTVGVNSTDAHLRQKVQASEAEGNHRHPKATTASGKKAHVKKSTNTTAAPPEEDECEEIKEEETTHKTLPSTHIEQILDKVLCKLEHLEAVKANANGTNTGNPEGSPCEIVGSWNSLTMGVRFDIAIGKATERQLSQAESGNKLITIEVVDTVPPKSKGGPIDTDWQFMGSALQLSGGPFYMYAQRREDKILATFDGFCRTCGGMDTIFGSWSFLHPSKDCQDISTAISHKRDIFRRYRMEAKRKHRFQELTYKQSKMGKERACSTGNSNSGGGANVNRESDDASGT